MFVYIVAMATSAFNAVLGNSAPSLYRAGLIANIVVSIIVGLVELRLEFCKSNSTNVVRTSKT